MKTETMAEIQNNIFVPLLEFLFSIMLYDQYNNNAVIITNIGLYLVKFAK